MYKKKRVLLRFYAQLNLGDDLFAFILKQRYKDVIFTATSPKLPAELNGIERPSYVNHYISRLFSKFLKYDLFNIKRLSRKNDLLVYIGGSIFIQGEIFKKWEYERDFYKNSKIPYYILGSNFGPYSNINFIPLVREVVSNAQDVCFRDSKSYEIFKDIPTARLATDISFSLYVSQFDIYNDNLVIFSIIDAKSRFTNDVANKYEEELIKLTYIFINLGYEVVYMSFCEHEGDEAASERVASKIDESMREKVSIYRYKGNLTEALGLIARSEYVVASRFHASIIGLLFEKKVLPMAYSAKTTDILSDINFTGPVIDINNINKFDSLDFDIKSIKVNDISAQKSLSEKQFQVLDRELKIGS